MTENQTVFEILSRNETDSTSLAEYKELPKSTKNFMVCITPRSGSTHLCDLLASTRLFGDPREDLNPDNLPRVLRQFPCNNIEDYIDVIRRSRATSNGVFGIKVSYHHLAPIIEMKNITSLFGPNLRYIFLTRNDFVLQAISLYLAAETSVFHSVQPVLTDEMMTSLENLEYNEQKIHGWIDHILRQEIDFNRFFDRERISPLRVKYEVFIENPQDTIRNIAEYIGVEEPVTFEILSSRFRKIGKERNTEWAARFKKENEDLVQRWHEQRGLCSAF